MPLEEPAAGTDESGQPAGMVTYLHGAEGELLATQAGGVAPVVYGYDGAYRVQTVTDHNGNLTTYSYNGQGYLSQILYPDTTKDQFPQYFNNGLVKKSIDAKGIEADYQYDEMGRLTDTAYQDDTNYGAPISGLHVHAAFNIYGQPTAMTDAQGQVDYLFDTNDLPLSITRQINPVGGGTVPAPVGYSYFDDGSRKTMSVPGGMFGYHYDQSGRPLTMVNPFGETTSWAFTPGGRLKSQTQANSLVTTYGYANDLPLSSQTTLGPPPSGTPMATFTGAAYDANGNRLTVATSLATNGALSGNTLYQYDDRNQLTQESRDGQAANGFYYDPSGNPLYMRATPNNFDTMNQVLGLGYDPSGNPASLNGVPVSFDALDHLTNYNGVYSAGYQADGLRNWKYSTSGLKTFYIYDGSVPVSELDWNGNPAAVNTFGPNGLVSRHTLGTNAASTFYSFDLSGNTALRTDISANVLTAHAFDAYGNDLNTTPSNDPFASFGGQFGNYRDYDTGLTLMGQRYYDPNAGRFVNRDPIGDAGGYNHYAYAGNNPVTHADPMGLDGENLLDSQLQSGSAARQAASMAAGCVPGLGSLMGAVGAITGCDYIAGTKLSPFSRIMSGVGAILPFAKGMGPLSLWCEKGFLQCFAPGTPIQMADGTTKPIEQIQEGDEVLSRDPETGKIEVKKVTHTFVNKHKHTLLLTLSDGDQVEATPEHPFYVNGKGFVPAGQLTEGMDLGSQNGQEVKVVSIAPKQTDATTYNFEVADDHTYFVGKADGGVLVHNDCTIIGRLVNTAPYIGKSGYNVFVPKIWTPLGNLNFLKDAVKRGDTFALVTDPSVLATMNAAGTGGRWTIWELGWLARQGVNVIKYW